MHYSRPAFSSRRSWIQPILVMIVLVLLCQPMQGADRPVRYYDDIKPLLTVHCVKCHGPGAAKGGLRLDVRERVFAKAKSGMTTVVPGDPGRSEILRRLHSEDPDQVMPQKAEPLSPADITLIRVWIEQGARWPDRDDYWAFQPIVKPAVPERAEGGRQSNPIDGFVAEHLAKEKLLASNRADPRTLLRRAFADLLGVPPSPAEADAFLQDTSTNAYEKLVDRLLADERYGERWARHWLDLVRYSESDGFEDDKIRPLAWRYRDYVIRSFNADKPYDRFVQEQIAGDELWPGDPDAIIATGFARLGMWDGMSKDPPRQRQDFLNDATDAVGSVFLGVTIGCARCHDHKYDAISQRDYYGLQAFFAGVSRETRDLGLIATDPLHVIAARSDAEKSESSARTARDALLQEAREELTWAHRCEVDERGVVRISDEQVRKESDRRHPGRVAELDAKLKQAETIARPYRTSAEATVETSSPPETRLLEGGELSRPGAVTAPAVIAATVSTGSAELKPSPGSSRRGSGRRSALARWITSADNPLTARVLVNRLWQQHFGRGIVATPSDFGRHGERPSHQELLDWLAKHFIEEGWSMKTMHRLMMTSETYQRSSSASIDALNRDPQNRLLSHANRRRLEGEAIRDSMLVVSGQLSPIRGGPGVYPRISKDLNVELPNNDKELSWYPCSDEENRRRSIYIFQRRSLTFPLFEVFDAAAMSQSCAVRSRTTVAPQALALFNGEFSREQARFLARRAIAEAGPSIDKQIEYAYRLTLVRPPSADELTETRSFLENQATIRKATLKVKAEQAQAAAFEDFCHVLLNTNEFIYLD